MNLFAKKKTTKTLILIILLVTIFTFITPNYCFAAKSTEEKLEYQPKKMKQEDDQEMAEEHEDLFEEEYEYDDD